MREVKIATIEEQLAEQRKGKMTAALFNLVVHVQDIEHAQEVQQIIERVLRRFPCRVIFLTEDPDAKHDYLHTQISSEELGTVTCDQLFLNFAGKQREKIPFIVLPHLLPDLPLYLLWTGDPAPDDVIFPTLEQHTSRILLDPDTLHHLPEYSRFVLMLLRSSLSSVADLQWASIDGWRAAIADAFDERIDILSACKSVDIICSIRPSKVRKDPLIQATYLQGWLASQLHWKFASISKTQDQMRISYFHTGKPINVQITAHPEAKLPLGAITSVTIKTHDGHEAHFDLWDGGERVKVQVSTPEKCDLPYTHPLSKQEKGEALAREIFRKETSSHYENTLELLSSIPWNGS